jgi:selT/selW/selH-like putative selenoprotein
MKVLIEYCGAWGYKPQALRVRDSLQKLGAADIELRVGRSGQFDVTVDGALKYTRSKTGRFPTDDEVEDLVGT